MARKMRIPLVILSVAAVSLLASNAVLAQGAGKSSGGSGIGWEGWGVRVGVSSDPDQVYGGFHFDLGHFAPNVRFRPTVEIGVGDDATLIQALAEAHYVFSKVQVWKPYVGGGVGISYVKLDNLPPGVDDTDNDLALMGIGGIETKLKSATRFFLEAKIGFGDDDPDLKLAAGWTW